MLAKTQLCDNRKYLKTFALCFLFFPSHSQVVSGFLKEENISGKVKAITETHSDGQKIVYQFNEKGLETEKWFFNPTDVLHFRLTCKYDSSGRLLEEIRFDKGIHPVLKTEYGYDDKGLPIGRTIYGSNSKPLDKFMYRYNTGNKITDSIRYDFYGNLVEKFSWNYDSSKHLVTKTWFKSADSSVLVTTYEYNENWKLIREKINAASGSNREINYSYDMKGNLVEENGPNQESGNNFIRKSEYDNNGNKILSAEYKPDGSLIKKYSYEYDSNNRKIAENWYNSRDTVFSRYTHFYDEKDNEIEMRGFNPSGEMEVSIRWIFEYDKTGNWMKRSQSINEIAGEIITRLIEYY